MIKHSAVFTGLLLFLAAPSHAGSGTTIFSFLKINPMARTAAAGDISTLPSHQAMMLNPAMMSFARDRELSFQHISYVEGISYNLVSYVQPIDRNSTFGVTVGYLGMPSMSLVVYDPSVPDGFTESGSFNASDVLAQFTYAKKASSGFSYGVTAKVVRESIAARGATGAMFSIGGYYEPHYTPTARSTYFSRRYFQRDEDDWRVSFSAFNLGPDVSGSDLPIGAQIGAGKYVRPGVFWGIEALGYMDQSFELKTGVDYAASDIFSLRAGYRFPLQDQKLGDATLTNFTAGLGINVQGVSLDYAWAPYGDLGQTHRVTLAVKFAEERKQDPLRKFQFPD